VDRGEAGRVGKVRLGQRQRIAAGGSQADNVEANEQLAKQVGDPGDGAASPDRQYLLAVDGRVEKGGEPQHPGEMRLALGDLADSLVRNDRDLDRRHRADIVLEALEQEAVQVDEVAGDVELHDLALAVGQIPVAADEAVEEQGAFAERDAGLDDDLAGRNFPDLAQRFAQDLGFLLAEDVARPQLAQQAGERRLDRRIVSGHPAALR
jgi:hypothetical protein